MTIQRQIPAVKGNKIRVVGRNRGRRAITSVKEETTSLSGDIDEAGGEPTDPPTSGGGIDIDGTNQVEVVPDPTKLGQTLTRTIASVSAPGNYTVEANFRYPGTPLTASPSKLANTAGASFWAISIEESASWAWLVLHSDSFT